MTQLTSKCTIKDVAARANVSIGTVSRVINGNPTVSREIVGRVTSAIVELGFKPNAAARSMRSNATKTIAFVVSDISNPLFAKIANSVERILKDYGFFVIFASTGNNRDREIKLMTLLDVGRVDAILLTVSDENDPEILMGIRSSRLPIILLDREIDMGLDAVFSDHRSGMRKAVQYLWRLNHRRIALITGSSCERPGRERLAGFMEAHADLGAKSNPDLVRSGSLSEEFGFQETYDLLAHADRPTAIIAGGNRLVAGAIRAIRQLKLRIPDDVSLIGCDETDLSNLIDPPLTVIARDMEALGRAAGLILLRRLSNGAELKPAKVVLPTEFIVRGSCADLTGDGA